MSYVRSLLGTLLVLGACTGGRTVVPADSSSDASTCSPGWIRFAFLSTSLATYCVGAPNGCSSTWLSIRRSGGDALLVDRPCASDCASCEPIGCPASCAAPSRMAAAGEQRTWDGTFYAASTCGTGTSCVDRACASAGQYVARMCAYRDLSADAPPEICAPAPTPTCTEVTFDWPPPAGETSTVTGVIGAADGPKCCPTSWLMEPCKDADAGAGWTCHDPTKGCASTTTCGEGCDFTVAGRCGGV